MIFDKLCGVAERHIPEMVGTLKVANIFEFEGIPNNILPQMMLGKDDDYFEEIFDGFFMPYPVTAIEDKASCVVLIDTMENQTGLTEERFFIEAMLPGVDNSKYFSDTPENKKRIRQIKKELNFDKNIMSLSYGAIRFDKDQTDRQSFGAIGKVSGLFYGSKKELIDRNIAEDPNVEAITLATLQNIGTAIEEVAYFNQPDKFILQRRNLKAKRPPKNKIARSHQRPIYTLLHPAQIRSKLGFTNPSGEQTRKTPHERRRHRRYLSDERYATDDSGAKIAPKIIPSGPRRGEHYYKSVDIPATWIGDSEKIIGNKRYKVILDR